MSSHGERSNICLKKRYEKPISDLKNQIITIDCYIIIFLFQMNQSFSAQLVVGYFDGLAMYSIRYGLYHFIM
jgi:hypothetical protein